MQVREIMTSPAITVAPETHIQEVVRIMSTHQISGVPVVAANGELLGVVTEHDLIARNAPLHEPHYVTVLSAYITLSPSEYRDYRDRLRHVMATSAGELIEEGARTIAPDAPVDEALEAMLDPAVGMLPVLEGQRLVGVVTRTDLVQLIEKLEMGVDDG